MNKKLAQILYLFLIGISLFSAIQASQYIPNIAFIKPSHDVPFATNASLTYSAGFANKAFDRHGKIVPFLEQYGPEDFLLRFVDPSLGPDNLESAGQGHISGKYHFQQYRFSASKNIFHKLFISAIMEVQDLAITDITPKFIAAEASLLPEQISYLKKLEQAIPTTIKQSGMYTTNFYCGYNERHTDFNHIESFTCMLLIGLSTPQSMSINNRSVLQHPCTANIHFGYPTAAGISVQFNHWFNLGLSGLVVPFQPTTRTIPINRTSENNHLLFSQSTRAKIDQNPFFAGTIYTEIKNRTSKYIGTIAYNYSQYLKSNVTPINTKLFPKSHANRSFLLDGFTLGSLLLQLDINCTSPEKKLAPIISLFFSVPITGKLYQQTYLFGGACNLHITYDF